MLDKNVYSPSSKGDVNTAGHMQSDAGAGKCSEGGVPLDPYSDAGTDFSLLVIQSDTNGHEGTSKEISMSITPTMEVHNKDVCSSVNIS
ncbi:zinc finger CCCH domain-containing protein 15-like, partial [Trifolium medium]|nr:zinc finger CCCH domain-containing protein 15-like [Trifolium medium]